MNFEHENHKTNEIYLCDFLSPNPPMFLFSCSFRPLLVRSYSIATPSLLNRYSIETMDNRWIIDGLLMDYLMKNCGISRARKNSLKSTNFMICFCLMSIGK